LKMNIENNKVFVLGIDGAFPEYIFGEWLEDLPNIKKLMDGGTYAKLNTTTPPLSATAWTSITTGKSPADTGIFEYIYRKNYDYNDFHVVTSRNVKENENIEEDSYQSSKNISEHNNEGKDERKKTEKSAFSNSIV